MAQVQNLLDFDFQTSIVKSWINSATLQNTFSRFKIKIENSKKLFENKNLKNNHLRKNGYFRNKNREFGEWGTRDKF